ncbi:MAG: phenylacetate--CoA ligase, partial [Nitratireductor sp.]|nr:phenylacetate--CoA ligase [Nitratireductor sp.]
TQIEEQILKVRELAPHFVIELVRESRLDAMIIHTEAMPEAAHEDARQASAKALSNRIKETVGVTARVSVREPGGVERSQGKAVRIIDKRPRE